MPAMECIKATRMQTPITTALEMLALCSLQCLAIQKYQLAVDNMLLNHCTPSLPALTLHTPGLINHNYRCSTAAFSLSFFQTGT